MTDVTTYSLGEIHIHVKEEDGRIWVSTDPSWDEKMPGSHRKYLGWDLYRTVEKHNKRTQAND